MCGSAASAARAPIGVAFAIAQCGMQCDEQSLSIGAVFGPRAHLRHERGTRAAEKAERVQISLDQIEARLEACQFGGNR
jgi:hypothetical protein